MDIKLDIYNEECQSLANSMYLKFGLHALAIERWYTRSNTVDENPANWLHYRNLAGLYHSYNTPMTIKSLDTFTDISFEKDVLKDHPTTMAMYREFGTHFESLVAKYPKNEVLIKGILYDRDIDEIIAMPDFHIVGWNKNLIDVQEHDLISILNDHLTIMGTKAGCPDYIEVNNNYPTLILGYVVSTLTPLIKRIRLQNSLSYNANTFYIWSNINSVINLEKYKNVLTYDDVMYLFKNIKRLKNGLASKDVFREVLGTIVTPKMIDAYNLRSRAILSSMDMDTRYLKADWDQVDVFSDDTRLATLSGVVSRHEERSNRTIDNAEQDLTHRLYQGYNDNVYPEITLYDNRENEGDIRENFIYLDYAFLFSGTDLLTRYYEVTRPDTGETLTLTHKEWLTIYMRIKQVQFGLKSDIIPAWPTGQLYNYNPISLRKLIDGGLDETTAQKILDIVGIYPVLRNDIAATVNYTENFVNSRSTVVSLLSRSYNKQNNIYIGDLNGEIFKSYLVSLYPDNTNYLDWLTKIDVLVDDMSLDTLRSLEHNILTTVIGISGDSAESLVNLMGSMLYKFVSYKTNISQKTSDTITLSLSSRPTWSEVGSDLLGVNTNINVVPTVKSYPVYDIEEKVDITPLTIETPMSKLISTPDVAAGNTKVTARVKQSANIVNLSPVTLTAEILEK